MEEPFPWRDWQKIAFGGLDWTPGIFWASSLTEFTLAVKGKAEANGGKKAVAPPSDEEMDELIKKYGG
ncbi:phage tail assembly chaperone [Rhizobium pusense]|uniref:phage tail assembly chaperone n=1 Tax=Agrobacterium pusense TaxID=648995 RepID=UPI0024498D46|nr:phage tail assembly chaperone [Agrobacterium pusense]MDH2091145.1 phage tail assembly chaperone [Agrobacterium pusense]